MSIIPVLQIFFERYKLIYKVLIIDFCESLSDKFKIPIKCDEVLYTTLNRDGVIWGPWFKIFPYYVEFYRIHFHVFNEVIDSLRIGVQTKLNYFYKDG